MIIVLGVIMCLLLPAKCSALDTFEGVIISSICCERLRTRRHTDHRTLLYNVYLYHRDEQVVLTQVSKFHLAILFIVLSPLRNSLLSISVPVDAGFPFPIPFPHGRPGSSRSPWTNRRTGAGTSSSHRRHGGHVPPMDVCGCGVPAKLFRLTESAALEQDDVPGRASGGPRTTFFRR